MDRGWTTYFALAWLAAQSACLVGCFGGSDLPGPTGTVTGNASYLGKPIPVGSAVILVHTQTGLTGAGLTDEDGDFAIKMRDAWDVLVGDYAVSIRPPGEPDENANVLDDRSVPAAWKEIPRKYWSHATSGETYMVKEGENDYSLVLRD